MKRKTSKERLAEKIANAGGVATEDAVKAMKAIPQLGINVRRPNIVVRNRPQPPPPRTIKGEAPIPSKYPP